MTTCGRLEGDSGTPGSVICSGAATGASCYDAEPAPLTCPATAACELSSCSVEWLDVSSCDGALVGTDDGLSRDDCKAFCLGENAGCCRSEAADGDDSVGGCFAHEGDAIRARGQNVATDVSCIVVSEGGGDDAFYEGDVGGVPKVAVIGVGAALVVISASGMLMKKRRIRRTASMRGQDAGPAGSYGTGDAGAGVLWQPDNPDMTLDALAALPDSAPRQPAPDVEPGVTLAELGRFSSNGSLQGETQANGMPVAMAFSMQESQNELVSDKLDDFQV